MGWKRNRLWRVGCPFIKVAFGLALVIYVGAKMVARLEPTMPEARAALAVNVAASDRAPQASEEGTLSFAPQSEPRPDSASDAGPATTSASSQSAENGAGAPESAPLRITSEYGYRVHPITKQTQFHEGVDVALKAGTQLKAIAEGQVTFAGYAGNAGLMVIMRHADGFETRYDHLSQVLVATGAQVKRGQVVALSGGSGRVTGPHLHFEARRHGRPISPEVALNWARALIAQS